MKLDEMQMRQIYTVGGKEVEELLESDFSEARDLYLKTNEALYRGTKGETMRIVDPKARGPRPNANMSSVVNAFIDTDPSWRGFPRRGQSIIMSSEPADARDYGDVAVVFPINGSRVGCTHKRDFWFVVDANRKQHHLDTLASIETVVETLVTAIEQFNPALAGKIHDAVFAKGEQAYKQAIKANRALDDILLDDDNEQAIISYLEEADIGWENIRSAAMKAVRMGWTSYLNLILNPRHAGLTVERIDDMKNISIATEYWTDGKCLLIDEGAWVDMKRDVYKK